MKELMYIRSFSKRRLPVIVGTLLLVIIGSVWLNTAPFRSGFDIADELGGNIFPVLFPFSVGVCVGKTAYGVYYLS